MLKKIISYIVIFILLSCVAFFGSEYFIIQKELQDSQKLAQTQKLNAQIVNFTGLFINKVLKANQDISFEDRLKLENAVRDMKDAEVLAQWQKFTNSKTEQDAQAEVKNLLSLLISKIIY
jgi:hypothetical protein